MIRITLSGSGGQLDAVDIAPPSYRAGSAAMQADLQRRLHAAIAAWTLEPGDIIRIAGDKDPTDYQNVGQFEIGAQLRDQRKPQR